MPLCSYKRHLGFKGRETPAEVIGHAIRDSLQTKHPVFMRQLAVNRIDVMLLAYPNKTAESRVAQQKIERETAAERQKQRDKQMKAFLPRHAKSQKARNEDERRAECYS